MDAQQLPFDMEPADALKQYVDEKVSKIARHLVKESGTRGGFER